MDTDISEEDQKALRAVRFESDANETNTLEHKLNQSLDDSIKEHQKSIRAAQKEKKAKLQTQKKPSTSALKKAVGGKKVSNTTKKVTIKAAASPRLRVAPVRARNVPRVAGQRPVRVAPQQQVRLQQPVSRRRRSGGAATVVPVQSRGGQQQQQTRRRGTAKASVARVNGKPIPSLRKPVTKSSKTTTSGNKKNTSSEKVSAKPQNVALFDPAEAARREARKARFSTQ